MIAWRSVKEPLRFAATSLIAEPPAEGELLRAYSTDGRFLGLARWEAAAGAWLPHKVLEIAPVEDPPQRP